MMRTWDCPHDLGLERLALLDDEYAFLGHSVFGIDAPGGVRERLRDDDSLRYATTEEVLADAMSALGRAEAAAPSWFDRVTRLLMAARRERGSVDDLERTPRG